MATHFISSSENKTLTSSLANDVGLDKFELSKFAFLLSRLPASSLKKKEDFINYFKNAKKEDTFKNYEEFQALFKKYATLQFQDPICEAVREIIVNALDASEPDQPIKISLNGNRLKVKDFGSGMDWSHLDTFLVPGRSSKRSESNGDKKIGQFGQGALSSIYFLMNRSIPNLPFFDKGDSLTVPIYYENKECLLNFVDIDDFTINPIPDEEKKICVGTQKGDVGLEMHFEADGNTIYFDAAEKKIKNSGTTFKITSPLIRDQTNRIEKCIRRTFYFLDRKKIVLNDELMSANGFDTEKISYGELDFFYTRCFKKKTGGFYFCSSQVVIEQFKVLGTNPFIKSALNFKRLPMTIDRHSIDYGNQQIKDKILQFIGYIIDELSILNSLKANIINSLACILTEDKFNLIEPTRQLLNKLKNVIFLPDTDEAHLLKIPNAFYLNLLLFKSINLPHRGFIGSLEYFSLEGCTKALHFFDFQIPFIIAHNLLLNQKNQSAVFFNSRLLKKWLFYHNLPRSFTDFGRYNKLEKLDFLPDENHSLDLQKYNRYGNNVISTAQMTTIAQQTSPLCVSIFQAFSQINIDIVYKRNYLILVELVSKNPNLFRAIDIDRMANFFGLYLGIESSAEELFAILNFVLLKLSEASFEDEEFYYLFVNENPIIGLLTSSSKLRELFEIIDNLIKIFKETNENDEKKIQSLLKSDLKKAHFDLFFSCYQKLNLECKKVFTKLYLIIDESIFNLPSKKLENILPLIPFSFLEGLQLYLTATEILEIETILLMANWNDKSKPIIKVYLSLICLKNVANINYKACIDLLILLSSKKDNFNFDETVEAITASAKQIKENFNKDRNSCGISFQQFQSKTVAQKMELYWNFWEKNHRIRDLARPFLSIALFNTEISINPAPLNFSLSAEADFLHQDPLLKDFFATEEDAKTAIEKTINNQTFSEEQNLITAFEKAKQLEANNISFEYFSLDKDEVLVVIKDDGRGMIKEDIDSLIIPGKSSKAAIEKDHNLGFFLHLKHREVYLETGNGGGSTGHALCFKNTNNGVLFEKKEKKIEKRGTSIFLKVKIKHSLLIDFILFKSTLTTLFKQVKGINVYFHKELINPSSSNSPIAKHEEIYLLNGYHQKFYLELGESLGGFFKNGVKISEIDPKILKSIPAFFKKIIENKHLNWKIHADNLEQNLNQSHLLLNTNLIVFLQNAIVKTCAKACISYWLEARELDQISDDFWDTFSEKFICHDSLLSNYEKKRDLVKKFQIHTQQCSPPLIFMHNNGPTNLENVLNALYQQIEIPSLKDKEAIIYFLNQAVDSGSISLLDLRKEIVNTLQINQLLEDNLKYNRSYIQSLSTEYAKKLIVKECDFLKQKHPHFTKILNQFEARIISRIMAIHNQSSQSKESNIVTSDMDFLGKFLKILAFKMWGKELRVEFYSKTDGSIAYINSSIPDVINVNLASSKIPLTSIEKFEILYAFFNQEKVDEADLHNAIYICQDWIDTLSHEYAHLLEHADCASTHDLEFNKAIAANLMPAFICERNVVYETLDEIFNHSKTKKARTC